jgi:hypothetical protein
LIFHSFGLFFLFDLDDSHLLKLSAGRHFPSLKIIQPAYSKIKMIRINCYLSR